jgi:prepilin peptidase CpaA
MTEIGISEYGLAGLLAALLLRASITDWRARDIANGLTLTIALLAPLFWWATGLSLWPDMGWQLAYGLGVFLIGCGLFAIGAMGGGDVKLLAGLALWLPGVTMIRLALIMSIAGGALTVAMLIRQKLMKSDEKPEIPYGLAISFAGLWVLCERYINHFS